MPSGGPPHGLTDAAPRATRSPAANDEVTSTALPRAGAPTLTMYDPDDGRASRRMLLDWLTIVPSLSISAQRMAEAPLGPAGPAAPAGPAGPGGPGGPGAPALPRSVVIVLPARSFASSDRSRTLTELTLFTGSLKAA